MLIETLYNRGFVHDCTNRAAVQELINTKSAIVYAGFDLTASSLHVGHMVTLMLLRAIVQSGNKIIIILGGGTTKIGDPSGKNATRQILHEDVIHEYKMSIMNNISSVIGIDLIQKDEFTLISQDGSVMVCDNNKWFNEFRYIDFLRDIGKHFSVNRMLTMDTFRQRLDSKKNLSFIEFNYVLLQSYDFLYLKQNFGCNIQIGGSDQWGNITYGIDLVGKVTMKNEVHGITTPLILDSNGKKIGKSESGNTVWLTPYMYSPYDYYQYFRNTKDEDVASYMKLFTELSLDDITCIVSKNINDAKDILAFEATKICHSSDDAYNAKKKSDIHFKHSGIDQNMINNIKNNSTISDIINQISPQKSKSAIRRLILDGGIKINGIDIRVIKEKFEMDLMQEVINVENLQKYKVVFDEQYLHYIDDGIFTISIGKKHHFTCKMTS